MVPPLQVNRDLNSIRYGSKLFMDVRNPSRSCLWDDRLFAFTLDRPYSVRLQSACDKYGITLSDIDTKCHVFIPPWVRPKLHVDLSVHVGSKVSTPVEVLRANSLAMMGRYSSFEHYFTDGSVGNEGTGVGVFHRSFSSCVRLPDCVSIFTAEAYALYMAVRRGTECGKDFTVFTDSYSCLAAIASMNVDHSYIARIINTLHHSPLRVSLCWVPSHCGIFGNEQADRIAKRALSLRNITDIKLPRIDFLSFVRKRISLYWQRMYDLYPFYKLKDEIGHWSTSCQPNRLKEVVLARLRVNCVKAIHLLPHLNNADPTCNCDGSRLTLRHLFFDCNYFVMERLPLLDALRQDRKEFTVKSLLIDDDKYCDIVYKYLKDTDLIKYI